MSNAEFVDGLIKQGDLNVRWREVFLRAARADYVPDLIWENNSGRWRQIDRRTEPKEWFARVHSPDYVVLQLDDGQADGPRQMTCSSSMPSANAALLEAADLAPGMRVCEAGGGYGWMAALLCALVGDAHVTTIELDPGLAREGQMHLHAARVHPHVVRGDAARGYPRGAPYDRIVSTMAVRRVPTAWLRQAPGGLIVTPLHTPLAGYGLLRLDVADDGRSASGHFVGDVAFMWSRPQRPANWPPATEPIRESTTLLDPEAIARDPRIRFALGLRLPDVSYGWRFDAGERHETLRVRLHDDAGSRAVAFCHGPRTVYQSGPRNLWDELEAAYAWYETAGSPARHEFEVTVRAAHGRHNIRHLPTGESWTLPPLSSETRARARAALPPLAGRGG
ncbi:protein-L-isoaspartate(D-aspartate) O-methyltransferase [Streptomyces sp. N35]|uniref:protein-L-isoaspartate(D-aspartate) O-methyltransferase n=1 Tax=Streptomyces sp. N35 TaxID=2795730 RepID=UPI0027DE6D9B|nr:protein-L-isoaspartate(D-aspartate) O-methyltransferase [Streptomyces sp. N35]